MSPRWRRSPQWKSDRKSTRLNSSHLGIPHTAEIFYLSLHDALPIWPWASNDAGNEPDVVMACAGDVPTLETLAAVEILRHHIPHLKIRVVNVVDLMTLQPNTDRKSTRLNYSHLGI